MSNQACDCGKGERRNRRGTLQCTARIPRSAGAQRPPRCLAPRAPRPTHLQLHLLLPQPPQLLLQVPGVRAAGLEGLLLLLQARDALQQRVGNGLFVLLRPHLHRLAGLLQTLLVCGESARRVLFALQRSLQLQHALLKALAAPLLAVSQRVVGGRLRRGRLRRGTVCHRGGGAGGMDDRGDGCRWPVDVTRRRLVWCWRGDGQSAVAGATSVGDKGFAAKREPCKASFCPGMLPRGGS